MLHEVLHVIRRKLTKIKRTTEWSIVTQFTFIHRLTKFVQEFVLQLGTVW